eukprot:51227-Pleurochrysis_carterae.AAC.1
MQHAQAVFFNLYTPYTMDSPSPVAPTFTLPSLPAPTSAAGPATRSGGAAPGAAPAAAGVQPPAAASVSAVRPLSADERDHFVISPETLANVDRQLMETILSTIGLPATRPAYRAQCQNSGRVLI